VIWVVEFSLSAMFAPSCRFACGTLWAGAWNHHSMDVQTCEDQRCSYPDSFEQRDRRNCQHETARLIRPGTACFKSSRLP
jgi:hypothetical protein